LFKLVDTLFIPFDSPISESWLFTDRVNDVTESPLVRLTDIRRKVVIVPTVEQRSQGYSPYAFPICDLRDSAAWVLFFATINAYAARERIERANPDLPIIHVMPSGPFGRIEFLPSNLEHKGIIHLLGHNLVISRHALDGILTSGYVDDFSEEQQSLNGGAKEGRGTQKGNGRMDLSYGDGRRALNGWFEYPVSATGEVDPNRCLPGIEADTKQSSDDEPATGNSVRRRGLPPAGSSVALGGAKDNEASTSDQSDTSASGRGNARNNSSWFRATATPAGTSFQVAFNGTGSSRGDTGGPQQGGSRLGSVSEMASTM
jgi:hypothetical protein